MGFVQDERGEALPDVRVTATLESSNGLSTDNQIIKSVTTDEEGAYEIILPAGRYRLQFEKLLYLGETVYYEAVQEEIKYIDTVTLFDESWTDSIFQTVYGQVSDAMNGLGVSDAQVKFRNGWNNTSGEYISNLFGDKTTTTDNNGNYSMGLSVGAYTAEISKDYNEYNLPDIDSTPDNKKQGEDDIDDAPVMLSVSTGQIRIYFTVGLIILVTIAGGTILIKKYVL